MSFDKESKHQSAVRMLCAYRSSMGLSKFQEYMSKSPSLHIYFDDFVKQYTKGNRGEIGKWL